MGLYRFSRKRKREKKCLVFANAARLRRGHRCGGQQEDGGGVGARGQARRVRFQTPRGEE